MVKIIDLSWDIKEGMQVFPGDAQFEASPTFKFDECGYNVHKISISTHAGTHIDVPFHCVSGGKSLDEIELDRFSGKALIIDFSNLKAGEEITPDLISKNLDDIKKAEIVIFKTGWEKNYGKPNFYSDFPGLPEESASLLCSQKIKMIGLESGSVHPIKHIEVHKILLSNNVLVCEGLKNLDKIKQKYFRFFAIPLKFAGLDGSPVRAFAIEE